MTAKRRRSRPAWTAGPSTGRRCGALTGRTATGTWSAPARRPRRSRSDFPLASGAPPTSPSPLHCAAPLWLAREGAGSLAGDREGVQVGEVRRQAHGDHALLLLGV